MSGEEEITGAEFNAALVTKAIAEAETAIREVLHGAGIQLDLMAAGALLSIAVDHFAAQPRDQFLAMAGDLHAVSAKAYHAGALCEQCRAELEAGRCRWCEP